MNHSSFHTDLELLTGTNTETAFRELYERYWQPLYQKALARLGTDDEAQDAVQELFISLWRNRATVQLEGSLEPYLFTALKYTVIKRISRKSPTNVLPLSIEQLATTQLNAEELMQYKELQQMIDAEVTRLPARMQEIYRLSRKEYLTTLQIADTLQLSEQTVKNTLSTALGRLRERLSHHHFFFLFLF